MGRNPGEKRLEMMFNDFSVLKSLKVNTVTIRA